jgi:hypothetical protein
VLEDPPQAGFLIRTIFKRGDQCRAGLLLDHLASVPILFSYAGMSLPPPREDPRRFVVAMALRRALKLVHLRKGVTEMDEHIMAGTLIEDLRISGWFIEHRPSGHAGFISGDREA